MKVSYAKMIYRLENRMITYNCLNCGNPFEVYPSARKFRATLYCSRKCNTEHVHGDPVERFWKSVQKTDTCWLWTGETVKGYGRFHVDGKKIVATHYAWELHTGQPVPDGLWLLHKCDNPPCVNPDHLFLGTALENNQDRAEKGRNGVQPYPAHMTGDNHWTRQHPERRLYGDKNPSRTHPETRPRGESHPATALTWDKVDELRALHATGEWTFNALAVRFGVSNVTAANIVKCKTWKLEHHP